ncbi:MAG: pyridoxine 5'-phosphate synthase [Myxococcota bacterium]
MTVALHVNVDHVATLRNARGTRYPDPVHAAVMCELAGCDGITVHLREDRRHIRDRDVRVLRETVGSMLNLEMAATEEMLRLALEVKPDLVTLVPERREERTTEGGLDVAGQLEALTAAVTRLADAGIPTSLFIDPETGQVDASAAAGAAAVELHTGDYAHAGGRGAGELTRLAKAGEHAARRHRSLRVAAGHGLTLQNTAPLVAAVPALVELNIGHALVADALFFGLEDAVGRYREAIDAGLAEREA